MLNFLVRKQVSLFCVAHIANHASAATNQQKHLVTALQKMPHHHVNRQMPDVQTVSRRICPQIEREILRIDKLVIGECGLVPKPAPL